MVSADHLAVAGFHAAAEARFRSWLSEELLPHEPAPSWCGSRQAEIIDGLVELLIQVTHRITVKSERRVLEEAVEVRGKTAILFRVAEAAVGSPEGA